MEEAIRSTQGRSPMSPVLSPLAKEKDVQNSKNDSLTSVDIQEMEKVRLSLQSMLRSSEHFLQEDKVSPKSVPTPDEKRYSTRGEDIFPNITTANLMSSYLNTDTKEVRMSSDSLMGEGNDATRKSSKKYDKSLLLENTLLNETLEKERSKRKHCEQQIKGLQSKLLETQQELAVAVSADRKKDVMINQLDKTLARVVEDWKKHEEEKFEAMNELEAQHENDAKFQQKQQEILVQFEKDLSLAAEALAQEQERAANTEREKDSQIASLIQERDELLERLEEEKGKIENLDKECESLEESARTSKESQRLFEQEKLAQWQEEKSQLESQIELITKAHTEDLENERKLVEHEKQVAEDSQRVLSAVQKEVQQLTVQLDMCFREKENLKTEITLLTAKFEAQRTRQDSEHRSELERQISKNLRDAQSQLSKSENEIKVTHKRQIEDLTKRYKHDLEEQLNNFHQQLKEKDRKLKETSEEYEERLTNSHNDLVTISAEREALRSEKHKMISRLQEMMQSHCAEAMSVLTATTENSVVNASKHNSTWMSRQTPVLVTSAGLVGPLRESTRAYSSFATPDNFSHVKQLSGIGDRSEVQQPLQYTRDADVAKKESDESVHKWVRLPTMPAESTMHGTYQNISDETIVNELRRRLQEDDDQNQQRIEQNAHYPPGDSQDPDIEEQEISRTRTDESLIEQSPEDLETTKSHLPLNLSTDVLKMLQQQQSRQTELNHYVRQLLKKSPSSTTNGDLTDVGLLTSDDGGDAKNPDRVTAKKQVSPGTSQQDMLSSESTYSDLGDMKQAAFTKSAATPGKRFSKIPVAQTPPNKDTSSKKSSGKSALTPEQVGQLTRLIQMYQKDNMDDDIPSPQKMFQYLREVQIRGEDERIVPSKDNNNQRNKNSFLGESLNATQHSRKESKAKRKLEVNAQPGKLREITEQIDPDATANSNLSRKYLSEEARRPNRSTLTSDSELALTVRKTDKPARKTQNSATTKPLKRGTGKATKAWK